MDACYKIRRDAEAEHDRATAILLRKLGQSTIWTRAAARTREQSNEHDSI